VLDRVAIDTRVRAHVSDLLERLAVCHTERPRCTEHGLGVSSDCPECIEITAAIRRVRRPDPLAVSLKMAVDAAVRSGFAEALAHGGIDSPVLVSIWCDGFLEGGKGADGRSPDEADQAVVAELERLGVDEIVTCEFPSVIGVSNDVAAAGVMVTKLVALCKGGIPIVGFEIKRNVIAVRSKRPLTFDEHKVIGDVCREYSVAVLGVPTRAPVGSYTHRPIMGSDQGWYWSRWRGATSGPLAGNGPGPWSPIRVGAEPLADDTELGPRLTEQGPANGEVNMPEEIERSELISFITRGTGMSVDDLRDATITLLRIVANAVSKLQAEVQP
jgi:hypothetical protein